MKYYLKLIATNKPGDRDTVENPRRRAILRGFSAFTISFSAIFSAAVEGEKLATTQRWARIRNEIVNPPPMQVREYPWGTVHLWFRTHGGFSNEPLPREKLREIVEAATGQKRQPIFAPEVVVRYEEKPEPMSVASVLFNLLDHPFLDRAGVQYVIKNQIPVCLADLVIPTIADKEILDRDHQSLSRNVTATAFGSSFLFAAATAVSFARRKLFMSAISLGAGLPSSLALSYWTRSRPYTRWLVDFRNALFALKLEAMGQHLQKKTGRPPAFIVTMGGAHAGIVENFDKGIEHNRMVVEEMLAGERGMREALGPYFDDVYLAHSGNVDVLHDILNRAGEATP